MSRNKANVTLPWYGFKPSRFRELSRLLEPVFSQAVKRQFIPFILREPMDSEWNVLTGLHYAIVSRLDRIYREREFERQHPEGDWFLNTMEACPCDNKLVIEGVFKNVPQVSKEESILNVPDYDKGKEPTDDDLPF